jgi:hypothetical protein
MATDDFFRARLDGMVDLRHPLAAYFGDRDRSFRLKVTGHFGAS